MIIPIMIITNLVTNPNKGPGLSIHVKKDSLTPTTLNTSAVNPRPASKKPTNVIIPLFLSMINTFFEDEYK